RPAGDIGIILETSSRPVTRLLGALIEIERLVKNREIVIPHQRRPAARRDQIDALDRVWPIADDITQTNNMLNAPSIELGQNGRKRLEIAVNIADDCKHTKPRVAFAALTRKTSPRASPWRRIV